MSEQFVKYWPQQGNREFVSESRPTLRKFEQLREKPEIVRLREENRKELQEMRRAAWKEGYEKAQADAKAEYAHSLNTMQTLVDSLSKDIEREKAQMLRRIAEGFPQAIQGLVQLFFEENSEELGKTLLRRLEKAVDKLTAEPGISVKLNPDDMKLIRDNLSIPGRQISLKAASNVRPGGFLIEAGFAEIDGDVQNFIDRYMEITGNGNHSG